MRLPDPVRDEVSDALARIGHGGPIVSVSAVSGGCINHGARIETRSGGRCFLKWNAAAPEGMFAAETEGLRALHAAASEVEAGSRPRVPRPLAVARAPGGPDWLLMEWLPPARPAPDSDERLGRGLALLHVAVREEAAGRDGSGGPTPGWHQDNWIGSLPQSNREHASWGEFWRDERIAPQLALARERGRLGDALLDDLVDRIPRALDGVDRIGLLHGDLWSGNTFVTEGGAPALVDPAVYHGHGEVDLAMSELFGGFGADFYAAYYDVRPISAAYRSHRRDLYQLYFLLVHVNLFGDAYVARSEAAASRVLAALG